MAWVRLGDDAASNETVLAVLEDPEGDDRSPEEVFGYVMLLASMSAVQWQDYAVSMGQAIQQARSKARADRLLRLAHRAGYGELQRDTESGRIRFLLNDDPTFIHMITKAEKDWASQQKVDNSNPTLTVQVRRRDGDVCRYCYIIVNFDDRKGGRGGTYDHRPPGVPAASPDNLVVACRTCNGARGEVCKGLDPQEGLAAADGLLPLLSPPATPYFKGATVTWLQENRSILIQYGLTVPARPTKDLRAGMPAPGVDTAPARGVRPTPSSPTSAAPAPAGTECDPQQDRWRPVTTTGSTGRAPTTGSAPEAPPRSPAQQRHDAQRDHPPADVAATEQIPADHRTSGSGSAGSGRDGTGVGRAPTDAPPQAAAPPTPHRRDGPSKAPAQRARRRGRRGGRPRQTPRKEA